MPEKEFAVIYRWSVEPEHEEYFLNRWRAGTLRLKEEFGALGSCLTRAENGDFVAFARWPSEAAREQARSSSGLQAFDLVCPERTSKNIGDFCLLIPGQEQVLMTKEIIVLRPGPNAHFDSFLSSLGNDVEDRPRPMAANHLHADQSRGCGKAIPRGRNPHPAGCGDRVRRLSAIQGLLPDPDGARTSLQSYLGASNAHHFFVSGAEEPDLLEVGPATMRLKRRSTNRRGRVASIRL